MHVWKACVVALALALGISAPARAADPAAEQEENSTAGRPEMRVAARAKIREAAVAESRAAAERPGNRGAPA